MSHQKLTNQKLKHCKSDYNQSSDVMFELGHINKEEYNFLLDWKDKNPNTYKDIKGNRRLCDLSPYEFNKLYEAVIS